MKRYYLSLFIIFISTTLVGQDLQIQKGNKSRLIKKDQFVEFIIETPGSEKTRNCGLSAIHGHLQGFSKDSLSINTKELIVCGEINGIDIKKNLSVSSKAITKLAFDDLLEMHVYKSQKAKSNKENLFGFGAILVSTGIITGLHILAVDGKRNKQALGISSAAQIGTGICLLSLSSKKKYIVKSPYGDTNVWRVIR